MFRNPSVNVHQFAMIPRADVPRSAFRMQQTHKTTFSAALLIPVYVQEVLPGDSFNVRMTAFSRMATPIYPIMDNMYLESFFFFVPCRLVWSNWKKFMGEQANPGDSTSFAIPQIVSPAGGFTRLSIYDYLGLPCAPNLGANTVSVNALPLRAYNLIFNEWFRDENLTNSLAINVGDGPDSSTDYGLAVRGKRHDYFTSCLPFTQKGTAISFPNATVRTSGSELLTPGFNPPLFWTRSDTGAAPPNNILTGTGTAASNHNIATYGTNAVTSPSGVGLTPSNLYADNTVMTINAIRLAFQTQKLLERDARGGTRYTEIVRSHFGVISPDARLQRPEFLGGGQSPVNITPIAQQTQTGLTGGATPMGTLAGIGTNLARGHGFSRSFTEHGYILGLVNVRADMAYQQGLRRLWSRSTRYDFYWPAFAMLGEQAVYNREIYADGSVNDGSVFGYQERWAEYRYMPSLVTGYFNSTNPTPLDAWHLAQKFASLPALNNTFIQDQTSVVLQRAVAAGASSVGQQFLCDIFFDQNVARPMPMYSVPGLIDHF